MLADGIETCRRSDNNFNSCLSEAVLNALRILKDGNAALNMPSIDPYHIDYTEATHSGGNANFNLKSSLKDIDVVGFVSSAKITRIATKFDKKFGIKAEVKTSNIGILGDYTMDGKILVLPIRGVGKVNVTLSDVKALIDIRGDYFDKEGETYINVTSLKVKLTPKNARLFFENIFKGDPVLTDTINNFMNENWELVVNTILPDYEQRIGERFRGVANLLFHNVPMKFIFPE